jgi:hypothetical protein
MFLDECKIAESLIQKHLEDSYKYMPPPGSVALTLLYEFGPPYVLCKMSAYRLGHSEKLCCKVEVAA